MTEQRVAGVALTGLCILVLLSCVSCHRHQLHQEADEEAIPSLEALRAEMTQRVFDPGSPPTGLPPRREESIDQTRARMALEQRFDAVARAGIATADRLERTDRVDLFLLTDNRNPRHKSSFPLPALHAYAEVLEMRSVEQREDVSKIVHIWDEILRRKEHDLPCACHEPTYGIRFFKGNEVLFETSIGSWNNFMLYVDGEPVWRVIPRSSSLWSYLSSIWPVPEFGSAVVRTNRVKQLLPVDVRVQ